MKWHGSSEGGGAARDVEPELCCLAGTVFLGAIVVTNGSKSEIKNAHKKKIGDEGAHQKWEEGKKGPSQVFIEAWNTSSFTGSKTYYAAAKRGSLRRRPSLAAEKRALLLWTRRCGPNLVAVKWASPRWTRKHALRIFPSAAAKQASPRRTKKYGHCVFALHL